MNNERDGPSGSPELASLKRLGVIGKVVGAILEQHMAERALGTASDEDDTAGIHGLYDSQPASFIMAELARNLPSEVVNDIIEILRRSQRPPDRMLAATLLGVQQQGMVERIANGQTLIGTNPETEVTRWMTLIEYERDAEALQHAWLELRFAVTSQDSELPGDAFVPVTQPPSPTLDRFVRELRRLHGVLSGVRRD